MRSFWGNGGEKDILYEKKKVRVKVVGLDVLYFDFIYHLLYFPFRMIMFHCSLM
jgi:hypothetical protein